MKLFRRVTGYGPWAVAAALGLDISYPVQAAPPVVRPTAPIAAVAATSAMDDVEAATNVQVAWLAEASNEMRDHDDQLSELLVALVRHPAFVERQN